MQSLNTTVEAQRRERDRALRRSSVPRELAAPLSKALASTLVKVITGPRRAGKSTLAFQVLADRRFAYLNFEDDALRGETDGDELVEAIEAVYGETEFFFFDEIQNYPRWESFINKLHRRGCNLVITGSNSRLLSRELASALTGRHLPFELLPFSFPEFLLASGTREADAGASFQRYLLWGGFPEVVLGGAEPSGYLRTLFDSVVLRDIVTRHRIRASTAMHDLLNLLINNAASRFSARSLERSLGALSTATIQKFIGYCREAYLVQDLQPYFFKPKIRLKADRKIYALDNGLISAVSQPVTANTSRLLENLVFVELVRRGFKPNRDLFYYQTRSGAEVDFLLRRGSENLELLQVTQNLSALKTREREIRALRLGAEELKPRRLTVVTLDSTERIRGADPDINVVPCRNWLTVRAWNR